MSAFLASTSRSTSPALALTGADAALGDTMHRRKRSLPLIEHRTLVQRALGEAGALSEVCAYLSLRYVPTLTLRSTCRMNPLIGPRIGVTVMEDCICLVLARGRDVLSVTLTTRSS